jgi:hypothetical protein
MIEMKRNIKRFFMTKRGLLLLAGITALFSSCEKMPDEYPPEPQLYYTTKLKHHIKLSDTAAFARIELRFTDGDGNIARDASSLTSEIYLRDSRDTVTSRDYTHALPMPYIDASQRPKKGGLEGRITLNLRRQFFPLDSLHSALGGDTMYWHIYIKDEANNKSNWIQTDTIYISL